MSQEVSVPFRGSILTNIFALMDEDKILYTVSVPFRGSILTNPALHSPLFIRLTKHFSGQKYSVLNIR